MRATQGNRLGPHPKEGRTLEAPRGELRLHGRRERRNGGPWRRSGPQMEPGLASRP